MNAIVPNFAKITDYDLQRLRDTLAYLDAGIIDGQEAKRRCMAYGGFKFEAPNSNRRLIAKKLRSNLRSIDACRAQYPQA